MSNKEATIKTELTKLVDFVAHDFLRNWSRRPNFLTWDCYWMMWLGDEDHVEASQAVIGNTQRYKSKNMGNTPPYRRKNAPLGTMEG
jgi:hypothetical protein